MGWFQRNFPTFAKLASLGKKNRQDPGARAQDGRGTEAANGRVHTLAAAGPDGAPSVGADQASRPGAPANQEVAEVIGASLSQAKTAADQRQAAQELRERSQAAFAQSQTIWAEAVRSSESAVSAYESGIAHRPDALASIKDQTGDMRARSEASQAAYDGVLRQASLMQEKSREKSLRALEAIDAAAAQVASELEEAARASSVANAALAAAMSDLRAAQAAWSKLSALPGEEPAAPPPEPPHEPASGAPARSEAGSSPRLVTSELEAPYVVKQVFSAGNLITTPGEPTTPGLADALGAAPETSEVDDAGTSDAGLDDEIANARPASEFPGTPGASAAEALQRELEALHPLFSDHQAPFNQAPFNQGPVNQVPVPVPVDEKTVTGAPIDVAPKNNGHLFDPAKAEPEAPGSTWDGSLSELAQETPAPEGAPGRQPTDLVAATPPASLNPVSLDSVSLSQVPADGGPAYTGRVYLMLDAALGQEIFESVWEAVEDASASGVIVDNRLLSRQEGVQMTLDLGDMQLDTQALHRRLPGVALEPLAPDRLRLFFPASR